jgi:hypothetical protein
MTSTTGHSDKEAYIENAVDSVDEPQRIPSKESSSELKIRISQVKNDTTCTSEKNFHCGASATSSKASNGLWKVSEPAEIPQHMNAPDDG